MSPTSPSETELLDAIRRSLRPRLYLRTSLQAEVAELAAARRGGPHGAGAVTDAANALDLREDLDLLHRNHSVDQVRLHRHRPWVGGALLMVKRLLLRLLTPVLEQQARFNASATRALQVLCNERERVRALEQRLERLEAMPSLREPS
jgi:hypothetical protein